MFFEHCVSGVPVAPSLIVLFPFQDEIQPTMDEIEDNGANFVCNAEGNRWEKSNSLSLSAFSSGRNLL
jgi:hypothetical protein